MLFIEPHNIISGVSVRTIWRRVHQLGLDSRGRYTDLSFEELNELVEDIKSRLPDTAGTGTVLGHMAARGITIPNGHLRVYQSLARLDPLGTSRRWNPVTTRHSYWVPGNIKLFSKLKGFTLTLDNLEKDWILNHMFNKLEQKYKTMSC